MRPEHCGFGRSLESLTPGDRRAVEDFRTFLEGRTALTADGKTYVAFSDPRAAIRVCGCRWGPVTAEEAERVTLRVGTRPGRVVKFTARCEEHAATCRSLEPWEREIHGGAE